jgi:hypothetical protein
LRHAVRAFTRGADHYGNDKFGVTRSVDKFDLRRLAFERRLYPLDSMDVARHVRHPAMGLLADVDPPRTSEF